MTEQLILDRYRLVERLALGGTAEVWRAHDEQLDRPVAVKRLHAHLLPDEASRQRLVVEARAAAGLSHAGIVGIYDVDATGESPAIVMELVDGESLAARIDREGPLPPDDAARITADVADALFHAHQQGVVHRDVKPGNVLLGADGRTRLVDFGIAHSLAASAERLTLTGTVIGTLHAMAPEQLAGGAITPRTDLYGLGVVLHQALTGRPPYVAPSPVALAEAQRAGAPPLDGMEPALAAVVAACLAFDPASRPLHAGALATALRSWLAGDPGPALGIGGATTSEETRVVALPAAPLTEAVPPAADGGPPRPRSRRRAGSAVAPLLAGLLAIAAAVAVLAFVVANPEAGGVTEVPDPTRTESPAPTPLPEWLAKRVQEVAERCGEDIAAQAAVEMAAMSEDEAKAYAEELRKACEDDDEGRGGGNGNGNGNRGGGNDD